MNIDQVAKGLSEISYTPVAKFIKKDGTWGISYMYPADLPFFNIFTATLPHVPFGENGLKAYVHIHSEMLFYGYVQLNENEFFVLGPIIEIPIDNTIVHQILKSLDLPLFLTELLVAYYESTPHYSVYKLAQILTFLNNSIAENPPVTSGEILPEEYRHIPEAENNESLPVSDENELHRSVKNSQYERELYSFVYTGQYEKMKAFIKNTNYDGDSGILAHTVMQQNKYLVIASITLASRAAVQGGLSYNTAMQQSDFFFRKVDKAQTFKDLFDTHKQMLLTFTRLVAERKLGKPTPPLFLSKVQRYIETHLFERITTEDIARALQVNRSYLSTQFKKECGIDLFEYINRLKIDEAKRLLLTTDLSLSAVAHNLAFSSQSHFATIFKKQEGITPSEFRKNSMSLRMQQ